MNNLILVEAIKEIAVNAGKAILDIYNKEADFQVESKADDSPLTIADRTANTIICNGLKKLATQYPIISEENKMIPYEERKNYDYYWLVDPLDGTKEFIKRNGEFTVNIALIHQTRSVMGVVYTPISNEIFWAIKGEGAFYNNGFTTDEKLIVNDFKFTDKALHIVCSRSHLNDETKTFVSQFEAHQLVPKGSSLKFLIIAQGAAEIYPRLAPTMEWDTAAAQIILEEAGGKVIQHNSMEALKYNKENMLNPSFVAYAKIVENA
ncbi:MAG TPA: 3'(2'),5'-bisphosphate nucleotidase [Bacteroidetes bacterium]|nr:3'(2'),5'-bisphosphate nucleotidase [Bacteroidota bacterium]